jgi:hypothetical protein
VGVFFNNLLYLICCICCVSVYDCVYYLSCVNSVGGWVFFIINYFAVFAVYCVRSLCELGGRVGVYFYDF